MCSTRNPVDQHRNCGKVQFQDEIAEILELMEIEHRVSNMAYHFSLLRIVSCRVLLNNQVTYDNFLIKYLLDN
ncbi:MAG: hypothetical protein A2161_21120 [Candidatus Schekmanbacteria bacterium RBG_13_48_7]|uniref:Uncharacterized protein n=1 Tax=Candidatus Schekmanbacteria bacterium RBG_13_48_7 TaxID=1817878 RepID=A0A1F7RLJ1_9BACT|nr:MAG: hypothetical protein A2161_21120 [Candidatus Schekmanbacteria bacterium RBG_13_48_7]